MPKSSYFNLKSHEEKFMKLNTGDRIQYAGVIYTVVAVIYTTIYLRAVNDNRTDYDYEMQEIYKSYEDIEFLGKE